MPPPPPPRSHRKPQPQPAEESDSKRKRPEYKGGDNPVRGRSPNRVSIQGNPQGRGEASHRLRMAAPYAGDHGIGIELSQ